MMTFLLAAILAGGDTERLKPLEPLLGTWVGEGEMPGVGKYTEEVSYAWALNQAYIKMTYRMSAGGKDLDSGEGFVGWDAETGKITAYWFCSDGSLMKSTVTVEKDRWVFQGTVTGGACCKEFRISLQRVDADTVKSVCEGGEKGKFEKFAETTHRRKK